MSNATHDLAFWRNGSQALPDFLKSDNGAQPKTFSGAWHLNETETPKIIPSRWEQLSLSTMLDKSIGEDTFVINPKWQTNRGRVILREGRENSTPIFAFEPDGETIEWKSENRMHFGCALFALAFIEELRRLLLRGWKVDYRPRQQQLNGRMKGKILVNETRRAGVMRGRPEIAVCQVLERTIDHPINRIFRYTLTRCRDILNQSQIRAARPWASLLYCEEHLRGATLPRHIKASDFQDPSLRGFYRRHGQVLALAKAVVRSTSNEDASTGGMVVPFLLYTPHLFERWIAAHAKGIAASEGWEFQWKPSLTRKEVDGLYTFIPDFIFKKDERTRILDAKYKENWEQSHHTADKEWRGDLHQILSYQSVFGADRVGAIYPVEGDTKDNILISQIRADVKFCKCPLFESPEENIKAFLQGE